MRDLKVGDFLVHHESGVGMVITSVDGGAHEWFTVTPESGAKRTVSRRGILNKYSPLNEVANAIACELTLHEGFRPGTVQLARTIAANLHQPLSAFISDPMTAEKVEGAIRALTGDIEHVPAPED